MTKIEQIEHFQTCVHRFSLLMPIGDFYHHHTLYIMYASRFKSPKNLVCAQEHIVSKAIQGALFCLPSASSCGTTGPTAMEKSFEANLTLDIAALVLAEVYSLAPMQRALICSMQGARRDELGVNKALG